MFDSNNISTSNEERNLSTIWQSKTEVIDKNRVVIKSRFFKSLNYQTTSLQSQKIKQCRPRDNKEWYCVYDIFFSLKLTSCMYGKWNSWRIICDSAEKDYLKLVSQNLAVESAIWAEKRPATIHLEKWIQLLCQKFSSIGMEWCP